MDSRLLFYVGIGLAAGASILAFYFTIQINTVIPKKLKELEEASVCDELRQHEWRRLSSLKNKFQDKQVVRLLWEGALITFFLSILSLVDSLHLY